MAGGSLQSTLFKRTRPDDDDDFYYGSGAVVMKNWAVDYCPCNNSLSNNFEVRNMQKKPTMNKYLGQFRRNVKVPDLEKEMFVFFSKTKSKSEINNNLSVKMWLLTKIGAVLHSIITL